MKHLSNKGQVMSQLGGLGIAIATLVILLAVTFLVLAETGSQAATQAGFASTDLSSCTSHACNATKDLTAATQTIPGWVPLIVLVVIGGVILGLVSVFGSSK